MSVFTAREAKNRFCEVLQQSQYHAVTVTRNGRPYARILGIALEEKASTEQLQQQESKLLSYLGAGKLKGVDLNPEQRVRDIRNEW